MEFTPLIALESPIIGLVVLTGAILLSSVEYSRKPLIFIIALALITNIYQVNLKNFILSQVKIIEIVIAAFGLEVLSALLSKGRFFEVISKILLGKSRSPYEIFLVLNFLTALLSAILSNVLVLSYMVMLAMKLTECLPELDPSELITSLIISSNLGSMATLIGDLSNIIVGLNAGMTFLDFITTVMHISIISFLISHLLIFLRIRRKEKTSEKCVLLPSMEKKLGSEEKPYLIFGLLSMILMFTLLLLYSKLGINEGISLGLTAIFILFLGGDRISKVFGEVDWSSIAYLGTLLLSAELVNQAGGFEIVVRAISESHTQLNVYLLSVGLSSFIDDTETAALLTPILRTLNADRKSWWALVVGSSIGSALTPWGSLANIIALKSVEEKYRISPLRFLKLSSFAVLPVIPVAYFLLSVLG